MSSKPDNPSDSYADQLSGFDDRLRNQVDDESTLQQLNTTIKRLLLGSSDSETDIRAILHKRLQDGHIQGDTFRLVLDMLENIVSDDNPTVPGLLPMSADADDQFSATTILPVSVAPRNEGGSQIQVGSILRDRFQLMERVASGGMGVVYKALDRRLEEAGGLEPWVAIKVLSPELAGNDNAVRALQQEAAKGRCLSHENIVRFIDIDRHDDTYFIVMEWLEGRSLATVLNEGKGRHIDHEMAIDIMQQLAQALDYAHRCGVIHADVKPSNVILTPSGKVKLIDFGIARIRQQQAGADPDFDPGSLGSVTPNYSSMQVLTGETPVPADDIFSLGCLMYRLTAGYRVFGPRNAAEAAEEGMVPQRPQRLTDEEWRALKKSLSIARVSRFSSATDFIDALSGKMTIVVTPEDTISTIPELPRETPWGFIVAGVFAIGIAIAVTRTDLVEQAKSLLDDVTQQESAQNPVPVENVADSITAADEVAEPSPTSETATAVASDSGLESVSDSKLDELPATPLEPVESIGTPADSTAEPDLLPYEPIDFSTLPLAAAIIPLASADRFPADVDITLLEDRAGAIVDLVRETNINQPLTVDFDEVGFSGNRSPWESGQYLIENDGLVKFVAGQSRARTTISMASDPLREPDRVVTLTLRNYGDPESELATINLRLEDDDQRAFEAGLPPNTVAFAVSRVSVRESDPAAQVDVIRFNPDRSELRVGYIVRGVTATQDQDYFEPRSTTVTFGAGQRSARILIPLVQDSEIEDDEALMLELIVSGDNAESDLFRRIAVMIRDDDTPGR